MVNYVCSSCGKNFNKKSNYLNHIENKKKPCKPNLFSNNSNSSDFLNSSDLELNSINDKVNTQPIQEINNTFKCIYCEVSFNKKYNLDRHLDGRCKIMNIKIEENNNIQKNLENNDKTSSLVNIDELDVDDKTKTILNLLLNQNKKLIEQVNRMQEENDKSKNKSTKTINNTNNTNNTTNNNTDNSTNNSNNITNNTQNNIINNNIILAHGTEDFSKIDLEVMMKCMSTIKHREILPAMTAKQHLLGSRAAP